MTFPHIPDASLQLILDALPDGIGVEEDGVVVWANLGFARLYGYSDVSEVIGRRQSDFVGVEDRERMARYSLRRRDGDVAPTYYQFKGVRRDGSTVDVEIYVASFTIDGRVYILGALRDMTERALLARRLEQSQRLEALGTLSRGISHDFNNVLATILGNVDLAVTAAERGMDVRKYLERVRRAAERGSVLTRQLQAFSGARTFDDRQVSPLVVVREIAELLAHSSRTVAVRVEADEDVPVLPLGTSQLQQVLMHLATNAIDAMPAGGTLTLACHRVEKEPPDAAPGAPPVPFVRLQVSDTGVGIRPSDLPRIFEPFFTTKAPDRGTGLGLAVVFGVVRSHCGWVDVESTVERGTRFTIWLPVGCCEPAQAGAAPPTDLRGRGETLLVVDDEPGLRAFYEDILAQQGYRVLAADGGGQALQVESTQPSHIHLAVVDLVMPGMDGVECALQLLGRRPDLRVLLCTGLVHDERIARLPPQRLAGVLRKPMSAMDLLTAVRCGLDRP